MDTTILHNFLGELHWLWVIVFTGYLLWVPLLLGKIVQDKFFVIRKGHVPIYALGLFLLFGYFQIISLGLFLIPRQVNYVAWFLAIGGILPILFIIIYRKNYYHSEWNVGKPTLIITVILLLFHLIMQVFFKDYAELSIIQGWDSRAYDIYMAGTYSSLESFHIVVAFITRMSGVSHLVVQTHFLVFPMTLSIASIIWYFSKTFGGNIHKTLVKASVIVAFIFYIVGYPFYGQNLYILASIVFVIGVVIYQIQDGYDFLSTLPILSIIYASSFSLNGGSLIIVWAIIFSHILYMLRHKQKYILKVFVVSSFVPSIFLSAYIGLYDSQYGIAMAVSIGTIYLVLITNIIYNYHFIAKLEEFLKYNVKIILKITFVILTIAMGILLYNSGIKWDTEHFLGSKDTSEIRSIFRVVLYFTCVLSALYILKSKISITKRYFMSIFIIIISIWMSPITTNIIESDLLISIVSLGYIIMIVFIMVVMVDVIAASPKIVWIFDKIFPVVGILSIIAILVLSKFFELSFN